MPANTPSRSHSKRHPYDWYVDETWCARQLGEALDDFRIEREEGLAVWDPCAGFGNTAQAAFDVGLPIYLGDIVDRVWWNNFDDQLRDPKGKQLSRPQFSSADFREVDHAPARCSIVFNPPYSYEKGILEQMVRHALQLTSRRVCALVNTSWIASGKDMKPWSNRFRLFTDEYPPQIILQLAERPSMPPGDKIQAMGSRAFNGGEINYCWFVWDVTQPTKPTETRIAWLPKLGDPITPIEGIA